MLPVWVIFQITGIEDDPFWRRLLSAYLIYEGSLATQWGMRVAELRVWIVVSQMLALISLWVAWVLIRFPQSARRALHAVAAAHLILLAVSVTTSAVRSRVIDLSFDRVFDVVCWVCCIVFANSHAVRQVLTCTSEDGAVAKPT